MKSSFRPDIQVLRAIAISLVFLFHLWPQLVPGGFVGVDVFFVVSGYLLISHLIRDVDLDRFSLINFWSRRVRRLVPASLVVLVFTGFAVVAFIPKSLWGQWLSEVVASIFYIENWVLANNSVDYLAQGNLASPTQHFWALSLEEQIHFFAPLLLVFSLIFVPKLNKQARRVTIFVIVAITTAASLSFSLLTIITDPAYAYFSTPVRLWEFGIGGLVAFVASVSHRFWSPALSLLGLVAVVITGLSFSSTLAYPGTWALIPVLATALVIYSTSNAGVLGSVYKLRVLQWLGDHSYSIYLWHWPLIVLAPYVLQITELADPIKVAIIPITLILAFFTARWIEKPFMASGIKSNLKPRTVFTSLLILSLTFSGAAWYAIETARKPIVQDVENANNLAIKLPRCLGAQVMVLGEGNCVNPKLSGLYPSLDSASSDIGFDVSECGSMSRSDWYPKDCQIGVAGSKVKIALVGDSHIGHYRGMFARLARVNSWEVDIYWKGGCPFSNAQRSHDAELTIACLKWVAESKKQILAGNYDLVVTSQASGVAWVAGNGETAEETAEAGLVSIWSELVSNGIPVVVIKDDPRPVNDVLRCLQLKSIDECSKTKNEAFPFDPQVNAVEKMDSSKVRLVNLDKYFCGGELCKPVIGHVVVYRDANHLTNTFALTLSPFILPYLTAALK